MREEEDSIWAMWARFEEFYNKDNADGVVKLFEENADRFTSKGEVSHGRAKIREQYVTEFVSRKADSTIQPLHAEFTIRFLRPDVAILDAKYQSWPDDCRAYRGLRCLIAPVVRRNTAWR